MVDLVETHSVGHVIVYPRLDTNSKSYLDGAVVGLLFIGSISQQNDYILIQKPKFEHNNLFFNILNLET